MSTQNFLRICLNHLSGTHSSPWGKWYSNWPHWRLDYLAKTAYVTYWWAIRYEYWRFYRRTLCTGRRSNHQHGKSQTVCRQNGQHLADLVRRHISNRCVHNGERRMARMLHSLLSSILRGMSLTVRYTRFVWLKIPRARLKIPAGILWSPYRGHVAPIFLQHHEHHNISNGNTRNGLCLAIYPWAIPFRRQSSAHTMEGASMTLVGLLPPLCDNGQLLVDGGYSKHLVHRWFVVVELTMFVVDNLPVGLESKFVELLPTMSRSKQCSQWGLTLCSHVTLDRWRLILDRILLLPHFVALHTRSTIILPETLVILSPDGGYWSIDGTHFLLPGMYQRLRKYKVALPSGSFPLQHLQFLTGTVFRALTHLKMQRSRRDVYTSKCRYRRSATNLEMQVLTDLRIVWYSCIRQIRGNSKERLCCSFGNSRWIWRWRQATSWFVTGHG